MIFILESYLNPITRKNNTIILESYQNCVEFRLKSDGTHITILLTSSRNPRNSNNIQDEKVVAPAAGEGAPGTRTNFLFRGGRCMLHGYYADFSFHGEIGVRVCECARTERLA